MNIKIDINKLATTVAGAGVVAILTIIIGFAKVTAKVEAHGQKLAKHDQQFEVVIEVLCLLAKDELPAESLKRCLKMERGR